MGSRLSLRIFATITTNEKSYEFFIRIFLVRAHREESTFFTCICMYWAIEVVMSYDITRSTTRPDIRGVGKQRQEKINKASTSCCFVSGSNSDKFVPGLIYLVVKTKCIQTYSNEN